MRFIIFAFLSFTLFTNIALSASIIETKHNLSISNRVISKNNEIIIKSQTEEEICVFCHIPHQARKVGKPLWNRSMPDTAYNMYNSDYLKRIGYPEAPSDLGSSNNTPGTLSRQCLSCHDGTIAVGAVYKLRRDFMNGSQIAMNGVDGIGAIPAESPRSFGDDLSVHHPVGFEYKPNVTVNFGIGARTAELKDIPDSPIKLFIYDGKKYIECSSCHDPHTNNKRFLRMESGANHGQNVRNTCIACHDKSGGTVQTAHQVTGTPYTDVQMIRDYGTQYPADLFCINCHTPHNGEGKPYLLRKAEQNTCFQGAGASVSVTSCHGTGASGVDIESVLAKTYAHPVTTIDGKHTDLDVLYGYDTSGREMTDKSGKGGVSWGSNKHAECMDCHNPHQAGKKTHTPDNQWYPTVPSNAVSETLKGVTGVEPIWPAIWTQPIMFSTVESASKEYQICFKCHSYWGLGPSSNGSSVTDYPSLSDPVNVNLTDVAWEMNKNNKSGHPVVISAMERVGSYSPKSVEPLGLTEPWKSNYGRSSMYCSDCHGSDAEMMGDPKGPHGSNLKFMLKGVNQYWPMKADGVTPYELRDISGSGGGGGDDDTGLFCKNCHDIEYPHLQWQGPMGPGGPVINTDCIQCHVAIPHGSPASRLIGYENFPAPYNYQGNSLVINGYKKASQLAVSGDGINTVRNIWDDPASAKNGCSGCHGVSVPPYDANPYP